MSNIVCPLTLMGGLHNRGYCLGKVCGLYTPFEEVNPSRDYERNACELIKYIMRN